MAYYVIAYPTFADSDRAWIEAYRAANDPRFGKLLPAHFTLVFGVHDIAEADFVQEIETRLAGASKIAFELAVSTVNLDDGGDYFHQFLVPETGHSAIIKLHDRLYSGALARNLRLDIDYIPHIGIGTDEQSADCKRRVDDINAAGISIHGMIEAVDIVQFTDGRITPVRKIALG